MSGTIEPVIDMPGGRKLVVKHLTLDFTGTLSRDGVLLPGVAGLLREIGVCVPITVLTADTFGKAKDALKGLPVDVKIIADGGDKRACIRGLGAEHVVHIGNGRNDVEAVKAAALGVVVVGPEGAAGDVVRAADIVVREIADALGLILHPLRAKATLRS